LRHKYNEFGQKNGGGVAEPAGGFQDPEEVFGKMFGGEQFEEYIGQISIGKDMKDALQQQTDQQDGDVMMTPTGRAVLTPEAMQRKMARDRLVAEEKARIRKERVDKLAINLKNKLAIFTEAARGPEDKQVGNSFREKCRLEAEQLKDENYGVELLHAIGRAYQAKSAQHEASSQFAPLGWFHGAKTTFNTVSDSVGIVRSAIELKQVFDKLQAAEQMGIPAEQMRKLEEQASEQGMKTMWKGVKLEVESVVREAAEQVLSEPNVSKEKLHLRVVALEYMAQAFLSIRKEGESASDDFVKVDTPASKQREAASSSSHPPEKAAKPATSADKPKPTATDSSGTGFWGAAPGAPPRPAAQAASTKPSAVPRPAAAASTPLTSMNPTASSDMKSTATPETKAAPAEPSQKEKEATLQAAYKAYESKRKPQNDQDPEQKDPPPAYDGTNSSSS